MATGTHKPIIGLLGGIGSGKSAVARMFASLGCAVIDADELARHALDEPAAVTQMKKWWGDRVVGSEGKADRRFIAGIVFNKPDELAKLESLTHPIVNAARRRLRERYVADASVKAIVEDCPLLLEKSLERDCDALVFVDASRESRVRRVANRGWDEAELDRREKQQLPLDIKAKRADHVVDNNAGEAESLKHVRRVFSRILQDQANSEGRL